MLFVSVLAALLVVIGALLWFTGWAENRLIEPKNQPAGAKPH